MHIIGLNGGMGVGKSTAVEILKQHTDKAVVLVKFAQPLYDIQEYVYGRISSVYTRPSTFIKDRKLLQWIGTEWGRDSVSQTLWVDLWRKKVFEIFEHNQDAVVVCDDCRFDNEAQVIREMGGQIIRITSTVAQARIDTGAGIQNHKSEAGIDPQYVAAVIENNGTLDAYAEKLLAVYRNLRVISGRAA